MRLRIAPLAAALLLASPARAADPADSQRARAEALFKQGLALQNAGDCEAALDAYKQSLAEMPSSASTMNAAFCLRAVGRADEALEMYDDLLARFGPRLRAEERAAIEETMSDLGKSVGGLALTSNVDALVFVDGRPRGRLPRGTPLHLRAGRHMLRLRKEGHATFERVVDVPAGIVLVLDGRLDPLPIPVPEAPDPERVGDHLFLEAFLGYAGGALHADADTERTCTASCSSNGVLGGLRGGYRFGMGIGVDLTLGYLFASERLTRLKTWSIASSSVTYNLKDDLRLQGSFVGLGVSYRRALTSLFGLSARLTFGVLAARSSDAIDGTVVASPALAVVTTDRGQVLNSQPGFVMPEIGADLVRGRVRVAASLGALVMATDGPRFTHAQIGIKTPGCPAEGSGPGCQANTGAVAGEIAYRALVLWVPQISAGYAF